MSNNCYNNTLYGENTRDFTIFNHISPLKDIPRAFKLSYMMVCFNLLVSEIDGCLMIRFDYNSMQFSRGIILNANTLYINTNNPIHINCMVDMKISSENLLCDCNKMSGVNR